MDSGFSIAMRRSRINLYEPEPPCGAGVTLREEYEYLKKSIRRLR